MVASHVLSFPLDPVDPADLAENSKSCKFYVFKVLGDSGDAPVQCVFDFSWTSHLKHLVLRAFLEDCLPEMLSKLGVLAERGIKKSKKHHTIAPAALGGCGGLGQLWEALAELREALGELWEGLECDLNS